MRELLGEGPAVGRRGATCLVAAGLVVATAILATAAGAQGASSEASCGECHEEQVAAFAKTHHVALERGEAAWEVSCEACHGDGKAHIEAEGEAPIFSFDGSPSENSQRCLVCHSKAHPRFHFTQHAKAGLECSTCHSSHPAKEAVPSQALVDLVGRSSATCTDCHESVLSRFAFNEHHRLEEGALECSSCHDPHEPTTRVRLGGFKQEQCVSCHTDKGGPFVFEHGAQRVEGCVACHDPHGAPSRHMLNFQSVAEQCYSCHGVVPGFHLRFTAATLCTNCHSTIHGSNLDPFFLK